ncbi:hypothetical protein [Brevifollis gellanilyticus]|uniref:Uncharacterized protein n=1 Tax=Brevifollis gellanilyticus TaxID=748831 RepID=A0A512MEU3_9BACT|nr:hypothetical protein [Brevifollis gellanilyticus]GEP45257.1 hypothetical protein BGE01nite_45480 [Brevifollis gellanilyticus]
MADYVPALIFFSIFIGIPLVAKYLEYRRYAGKTAVKEGIEYRNNHHVLGVGYYHASTGMWHLHPWNEYREDRGYYWSGEWHAEPDQRPTTPTTPSPAEIDRVNKAWRKADPQKMVNFWAHVDRFGFGHAVDRHEGS